MKSWKLVVRGASRVDLAASHDTLPTPETIDFFQNESDSIPTLRTLTPWLQGDCSRETSLRVQSITFQRSGATAAACLWDADKVVRWGSTTKKIVGLEVMGSPFWVQSLSPAARDK